MVQTVVYNYFIRISTKSTVIKAITSLVVPLPITASNFSFDEKGKKNEGTIIPTTGINSSPSYKDNHWWYR